MILFFLMHKEYKYSEQNSKEIIWKSVLHISMYNSRTAVRNIVELQFKISWYTNLAQDIAYILNVNRSRDFMIYVDAPRECPASPLTYLGSENRITSISSAASGPFRFSRAPSSLYLVVESLCLSRSRARSYNAGAAMERGRGGCGLLRAIYWFKPFHLYLALAHATPHPRFSPTSHFSRRVAQRCWQARKDAGKAGRLLSIKYFSTEAWWSPARTRAQRASG